MFRRKWLSMVILAGMLFAQSAPLAAAATACDSAQFVSDLTIPDGSSFQPGTTFTKTWRLLNNGTCTWTTYYKLVWVGGDQMNAPVSVNLPVNVLPGKMLDLSVRLTAPATLGHYKALFKLSNTKGTQFGIGSSSNDPFWADINVVDVSAVIYDFVANAPYAQWKSGAGALPFPGTSGDFRGYSYQVNSPHLEDDSYDTAPGLLTVPQNKYSGHIQATYPEFQVQAGDKLQTLVNCEFGATGCYVTFRVDYILPNNVQKTLWTWKESYDKRFYRANLDLSSLAGQKVRFVFMLLSGGFASGDRAIWGSPRIVRLGTFAPPAPPSTLTPLPPLPATATPLNQPPPTIAPTGCDKAAFVSDVTVQDGTVFAPGAAFTKTWRLKNVGACVWTTAYKLVYYSGEQMGAPTTVNLAAGAAYGQSVDISVNMVALSSPGAYRGYWILANASGQFFGIGTDASKPIWVDINVSGVATNEGGYDFSLNACSAQWRTGSGPLPCPGTDGDGKGFVIPMQSTQLEDGNMGSSPSLLISPENKYNGYIQGVFPAFTVQPRDRFITGTGCEYNYSCYVTFRLDYIAANGLVYNFWSWREQSDRRNNTANIDLSPLAGRSVRFILTILASGSATGDRVRWIAPSIVRVEGGTPPTVTPAPSTWPTYTNPQYGFQFKYPPQSQITDQSTNYLKMKLPITPGTNLAEKYLETTVVENTEALCQSPLSATSPPGSPTETIVINGVSFLKQVGGDAAAGNLYQWVAYSTQHGNACISMGFVLHSLGAIYPPPPDFDKAAESAVFTQIMSTFGWLPGTATPTPITISGTIVPSPQINKLYMNDSYHGWAVGNSYVLKTSDGGATWYNVTTPGVSRVVSVFFQNANKGWIMATFPDDPNKATLFRTTNGGSTWISYSIPFNDGYIQFLDDSNGFVLAGQGIGMQKQPVSLYQTSDGGATWTLKFAQTPDSPDNGLPVSGHKIGIIFRNTTRGWIGGESPLAGSVYIYRTDNGGLTWAQQPMAIPAGYETGYVVTTAPTFFGTYNAVLPVWLGSGSAVGQRDLYLYVTHDGGTTWARSYAFAQHSFHIDIVSVNDAFSWDAAGFFRVTHNSGASWTQVTPNINFGENIYDLDFVSTTTGWVLDRDLNGNTALYRTTNGGSTWTPLFNNIPTQPVPDLTITAMRIELQNTSCLMAGDLMGTRVSVQNNGQAAAGSFILRVNNIDQTVSGLGVGETTTLFFPTTLNPVTAMADATGTVLESNENNNARSEMVPVPTPPMPCLSATDYAQTVVNTLNAKNFDAVKAMMGQSFGMGFWQSEGSSYTPDLAIQQLQTNYIGPSTVLVSDSGRDLNALLGGSNPYSIMGLDPANSQALFVSGWGLDGKGEAILYVTKHPDGTYSFDGVLIASAGFAPPASPVALTGPYAVVRVASTDVLNIRSGAGTSSPVVGSFAPDTVNVMRTGPTASADNATWVEVQNPGGGTGWVNSYYLTEYVGHDAFCADARIPVLLDQLKGSINQSSGDMLAAIVSPAHGMDVSLWRNAPANNFNPSAATNIFSSTEVLNWGTGGGQGGPAQMGTFAEVIQPKLQEVFNDPNLQSYCDTLTPLPNYPNMWPYGNIHYYNLYKPGTPGIDLDFRSWLIGFEYINGQPYLYGMVTIVWEP